MRRQRNMSQMKKQKKTTGKNLNKMETSNLPDTQFKTLIIGCSMISVKTSTKRKHENGNRKHKEPVRNNDIITETNTLEGINSIMDKAEDQISNLEHKIAGKNQDTKKKKDSKKNEDNLKSLWDNIKHTNTFMIRVSEGEKRE